jgi:uncharacterized membrane-anchored protein
MGTAFGDFTAYTLHLGYFTSAAIFAVLIALPALGFAALRTHAVALFWAGYVVTRALGASIADGLGKPASVGGGHTGHPAVPCLGLGNGTVALALAALIALLVAYLNLTGSDLHAKSALEGPTGWKVELSTADHGHRARHSG